MPALACCVFLLLTTVIFLRIRQLNGGPFTYALDDAYIHLGLSDQIAHGHYGINENEYSSPASSILWPFLLALFSPSSIHLYLPLLLSMAAGLVAVYALARIMQDLSPGRDWWTVAMTVLLISAPTSSAFLSSDSNTRFRSCLRSFAQQG